MKTLIIDVSSVIWTSLLAGKSTEFGYTVEHEGKSVHVNGWEYGLENAISHVTAVARELDFNAAQMIFVVEGKLSKARRVVLYPGYKEGRGSRPPEAYVEFGKVRDALCSEFSGAGATVVTQDGVEGDDVIAYLVENVNGSKVILTQDGDLAVLIGESVSLFRNGALLTENPFGPFPSKYITVYKALVGDTSDGIKGCPGFGDKAFLNMLVWGGNGVLPALDSLIRSRELHTLEEDVAEFKPMRKIIDFANSIYASHDAALLYPEWVNTKRQPLVVTSPSNDASNVDPRVSALAATQEEPLSFTKPVVPKNHAIFDIELIGLEHPVFLVCMKVIETGEKMSFWHHVPGDMDRLRATLKREDLTFVSFNGIHFDQPIIWAALSGLNPIKLKQLTQRIITEGKSFGMAEEFGYSKSPEFDHIDLMEVAPGVKVSLKAYAGRMHYPTMVDMPFSHDDDLTEEQLPILEAYCQNDLGVTEALFNTLRQEINLRIELSAEYDIDLRSKSDAQCAEAVLRKVCNVKKRPTMPGFVKYKVPSFISTNCEQLQELIQKLESTTFKINQMNGQVEAPDYLADPIELGRGSYQMGVGGLHSTHDVKLHVEAGEDELISDIDVAGFYPRIILNAGIVPKLDGGEHIGKKFLAVYQDIYNKRIEAKRTGNKKVANSLKIFLNGLYGKLGSMYSFFYAPELLLNVTLSGQLLLLILIAEFERDARFKVRSANTDGIIVSYPPSAREKFLKIVQAISMGSGFEFEETRYGNLAMKDVNNYFAATCDGEKVIVSPDGGVARYQSKAGEVKRKGIYASCDPKVNPLFLQKNPQFEICSDAVAFYLMNGTPIQDTIISCTDIRKFVAIRAVKGGGIQYDRVEEVDDWFEVEPGRWSYPGSNKAAVKRKSPPPPRLVGIGGTPFGRICRWYISTEDMPPICYIGSGNKVPQSESGRVCMTLPSVLPEDINHEWYVKHALEMLADIGVIKNETV